MQLQGANIVTIRGDGAGEFGRSSTFREELKKLGLKWESTPPYTHQQQGLVERAIRQIVEGGRAQLARASLGDEFWTWACKDFAFKSNCIPHQALGGVGSRIIHGRAGSSGTDNIKKSDLYLLFSLY